MARKLSPISNAIKGSASLGSMKPLGTPLPPLGTAGPLSDPTAMGEVSPGVTTAGVMKGTAKRAGRTEARRVSTPKITPGKKRKGARGPRP